MNEEVKELWASALESGEYKQGTGLLCRVTYKGEKRWCCLGVLCDLAVKKGIIPQPTEAPFGEGLEFGGPDKYSVNTAYLPQAVAEWAGFEPSAIQGMKFINPQIGESVATELNDIKGVPFPKLAALIREHL